jgi:hypothetical protein
MARWVMAADTVLSTPPETAMRVFSPPREALVADTCLSRNVSASNSGIVLDGFVEVKSLRANKPSHTSWYLFNIFFS